MDSRGNRPPSSIVGENTTIEKNVVIGEKVKIGHNCVLLEGTIIGEGSQIGNNVVLGCQPFQNSRVKNKVQQQQPLKIGNNCKIGSSAIIYAGVILGEDTLVGDLASIREKVTIGNSTVIGRSSIIECRTTIGNGCMIQSGAYITADMIIEDYVFVGPMVSTSNDKYIGKRNTTLKGPHILEGASIGNNATLLPGIVIGKFSIVGAGAVVTKDVLDHTTVVGVPAKVLEGNKKEEKNEDTIN